MRTILVLLSALGLVFAAGLACGLLLQAPTGEVGPVRFRGRRGIGVDIGFLARRRNADNERQDETASAASDADRDWDTYDSGAANTEPA
jgi:hypothetical protein